MGLLEGRSILEVQLPRSLVDEGAHVRGISFPNSRKGRIPLESTWDTRKKLQEDRVCVPQSSFLPAWRPLTFQGTVLMPFFLPGSTLPAF